MRVLHFSYSDTDGGAAKAAYRLHRGLLKNDIISGMQVQKKMSDDWTVMGPRSGYQQLQSLVRPPLDRLLLGFYRNRAKRVFYPSWIPGATRCQTRASNPDIVHLHWVCKGFLRPESLIRFRDSMVWTLHDMWPFTGGCHYDGGCGRYTESCGKCPQLGSSRERDLSRWVWRRKKRAWADLRLTIVTPSSWLAECASKSPLFKDYRIQVIPNGLDLNIYRPMNRETCREILGLPTNKRLILFGAMSAMSAPIKGYDLFCLAIKELKSLWSGDAELVVFGASEPKHAPDLPLPVHYLGRLNDEVSLALLYAAADVMVSPSRQDNLPNTVVEALACGTPSVAFDVGGIPEMIEHKRNGYLARPFDTTDLAAGIYWVLLYEQRHKELSAAARKKALTCFDMKKVAERYTTLYGEVLGFRGAN